MKSLILYWSAGGNTKQVADAIEDVLVKKEIEVDTMLINENLDVDLYKYDVVFFGAPSYQFLPPESVIKYIRRNMEKYEKTGDREVRAPKKYGKYSVIFCTYAGVHTGIKEAYTAGKYMAQFFEHLGFLVWDEWYTVGRFHGWEDGNLKGKIGDISDRPNTQDINIITQETKDFINSIKI